MRIPESGLFETQLSRKEFLRYTLGLLLAIFGVSNFINAILRTSQRHNGAPSAPSATHGFGASKFGR